MGKHRQQIAESMRSVRQIVQIAVATSLAAILVASSTACSDRGAASSQSAVNAAEPSTTESALPVVQVHKTPTCGCCSKWVDHLRDQGFDVRTTDVDDLTDFKAKHGVPTKLESCHTALVAGYVVEGHVPGADVKRLLQERPAVAGLAVPGMPLGSPGMEVPGTSPQPYEVVAFQKDGRTEVFATHGR